MNINTPFTQSISLKDMGIGKDSSIISQRITLHTISGYELKLQLVLQVPLVNVQNKRQ
jgi:hypothetical protein